MHFRCGLFLIGPPLIYTYRPSRFPRREAPRRPPQGSNLENPGEGASMDAASKEATSKEATSLGSPWAPTVQLCGSPGNLGAAPRRLPPRRRSSSHFPGEPRGGPRRWQLRRRKRRWMQSRRRQPPRRHRRMERPVASTVHRYTSPGSPEGGSLEGCSLEKGNLEGGYLEGEPAGVNCSSLHFPRELPGRPLQGCNSEVSGDARVATRRSRGPP